jgi:hypothetical protein
MGRARKPQTNPTPRKPARFREREVARVVRAAKSAGGERVEIDPETGKISVIIAAKPGEADAAKNPWDEVLPDGQNQKRPA